MAHQPPIRHTADTLSSPPYYARAANGNVIPTRATQKKAPVNERETAEDKALRVPGRNKKHPSLAPVVILAMGCCLAVLLFWQGVVTPAWGRYQEQLACGSGHVCLVRVMVTPGNERTFIAIAYKDSLIVYELPDSTHTDGHTYRLAALYPGTDWQNVTPLMEARDVNNDGYMDMVIDSPDFQAGNPVLYNQGNGTFDWHAPQHKASFPARAL